MAKSKNLSRSSVRSPRRSLCSSLGQSPIKGPLSRSPPSRRAISPSKRGRSQSRSISSDKFPKYIRRDRRFRQKYSYARHHSSPVRSRYDGRSLPNYHPSSPPRHYRSPRERIPLRSHSTPSDMDNQALAAFEGILGYRFTKKSLLEAALTHDSYCSTLNGKVSFEQLVLMGDRVVNFFFKAFTNNLDLGPKQLTLLQCPDINDEYLACICVTHRLHPYIRHKLPILERRISELIQDMEIVDLRFCGLLNPPKVLWDVVKSVLGAIYMDSDFCYNTVWKIFSRLTHPLDYLETFVVHPIEELEQLCESLDYELDFDENWEEDRTIRVLVNGESVGGVTYRSNEEICKNRAAKLALDMLN